MQVIRGLKNLASPLSNVAMTLGNFDGIHLGHRSLISQVIEMSKKYNGSSLVMTFDPHPSQLLRPDRPAQRLFDLQDQEEQLRLLGVDQFVIEPFTESLAQLSPDDFIKQVIWPYLHPQYICVGHDFAFGRDRQGSFAVLERLARHCGFQVEQIPPVLHRKKIISSSRIREEIRKGHVETAREMLARPYYVKGRVIRGEGRGRRLGFPTANVAVGSDLLPGEGVYITHFLSGERTYASLTNIGRKPTFHESYDVSVECYALDGSADFLNENVRILFLKYLRGEMKFPSAQDLVSQIKKDVVAAKKYFGMDDAEMG